MGGRSVLGPADVDDATLTAMVADLLGAEPRSVELLDSHAEEFPYELPAITTAGRYVVRGSASVGGEPTPYEMFVKVVQSWSRSEFFQFVPEEMREIAEASVPWRTEPLAYRSDLADRLPAGLRMPRALGVFDLDDRSASVWLEKVAVVPREWHAARYERAAYLLGRMSGSARVAELARVGEHHFTVADYAFGRLALQVVPQLRDDTLWQHPLVASAFDSRLRADLLAAADRIPQYVEELMSLTTLAAHGDACPNNLLTTEHDDAFTLIDYGFWQPMPPGADLAQLLAGDVQIGRCRAGDLAGRDDRNVAAYVRGLADEGSGVTETEVRRSHALHMLLFTGLSSLPVGFLDQPASPVLQTLVADRATIARFCLDRVSQTDPAG